MIVLSGLAKNVHIKPKDVYVDNIVFRLHYRLTFWFLMVCTILVCSRQYIGDHIDCIAGDRLGNIINTYCFFMTTYTVVGHHNYSAVRDGHAAHPGVGPDPPGAEIKRHSYYQWVPFVLFGQALLFYLPHYLWKTLEKGRVKAMVEGMRKVWLTSKEDCEVAGNKIHSLESKFAKVERVKASLMLAGRLGISRDWARCLVLCEVLNAVNICLQIFMVDRFLGGQFLGLGSHWFVTESEAEVLDSVFPKMTKCTFHKYGSSGTIQLHDTLCVMALNIINEKIYVILWFWFAGLLVVTCLGLVWRLVTFVLHSGCWTFNRWVWSQVCPGPSPDPSAIRVLTSALSFSDWLLLYYVGKNMDGSLFRELINLLAELYSPSRPSPSPPGYPSTPDESSDKLLTLDEPDNRSAGESSC